ncbi:MAG: cupin domain-containing protein [Candidatus Limnocylindria bacterium]
MTMNDVRAVARGPEEGEAFWILGGLYAYRALPTETGAYLLVEVEGPHGFAVPTHFHEREDEGFYVTAGVVRILLGDRMIEASAGSFVLAPRGERHAFVIASPNAKLLLLLSPGSEHEQLFRAIGEPAARREIPPPASEPPDLDRLAATAARYDSKIVGPPPS